MNSTLKRIQDHKIAKKDIEDIFSKLEYILIIHYSCEGFTDVSDSKTPKIVSIVVKNLEGGQTKSFSIDAVAEIENMSTEQIILNYEMLEKKFLDDFFAYVNSHNSCYWINWNMRNIKYGFDAISQRYRVLGGDPFEIDEYRRKDLSRIFDSLYGDKYISDPKLVSLATKNGFNTNDLLNGKEEAEYFKKGDFAKIHLSTLRKVELIDKYLKHSAENNLKINSNLITIYGLTPQGIFELIKDNWIFSLIFTILGIVICSIVTKFL